MHNQILELLNSRGYYFKRNDIITFTPKKPGIYTFWLGNNTKAQPIYVGKHEENIMARLLQHKSNCHNLLLRKYIIAFPESIIIKFITKDRFAPNLSLSKIEKIIINKLNPLTNKTHNII